MSELDEEPELVPEAPLPPVQIKEEVITEDTESNIIEFCKIIHNSKKIILC